MKINELFRRMKDTKSPSNRKYNRMYMTIALCIGIGLFLLLWTILSITTKGNIIPSINETFSVLFQSLSKGGTYQAIGYSFLRVLAALVASTVLAIFLGALAGYYPFIEYVLKPTITVLRSFPSVALVLILIIYTKAASFLLVSIVLFPIIYEAVVNGCKEVKREYQDVLSLDSGEKPINVVKVILPLSFDYIAVGVLQSIGLGLKVQIMGETFMGSTKYIGLGKEIYMAYLDVNMPKIFALALIAIFIVLVFDLMTMVLKKRIKEKMIYTAKVTRN